MVLNKKIWVAVGFIIVAFTSILVYARYIMSNQSPLIRTKRGKKRL